MYVYSLQITTALKENFLTCLNKALMDRIQEWGFRNLGDGRPGKGKNHQRIARLPKRVWLDIYLPTYIPLTLYPRRGSKDISDIPPRHPDFTKMIQAIEELDGGAVSALSV
jgi:hypothetical protein